MTIVWAFLSRVGLKVWLFAAGLLAIAAVLLKVRKSGADAERAKQIRNSLNAERNRAKIDDDIRRDPADDRGLRGYYRD